MRTIAVFMLLFCVSSSMAQDGQYGSIRVKVFDAETDKPIPFVSVYLDRTTIGGYTSDNGEIEVTKIPYGTYVLVMSSVGYKPQQRKLIIKDDQPVHITTKLALQLLQAVEIKAKRDDKWQRQFSRFERLFFGPEHFKECKITNPYVINFKTVDGDFIAEAKEPLKIENNYLGYELTFEMKACTFNNTNYVIRGNVRFEDKKTNDSTLRQKWIDSRVAIYRGSPQHFFKSVIKGEDVKEGFDLYSDVTFTAGISRSAYFLQNLGKSIIPMQIDSRVTPSADNSTYTIKLPSRLEVHYLRKRAKFPTYRNVVHAISFMEVKDELLVVNRYGVVQNPDKFIVIGDMSNLRVADWLPIDYEPATSEPLAPIIESPVVFSDLLLEKPYIQTDRNYYYNRETIWMKGYMNYLQPMLKDSLSHSIYVDLVDSEGKIVHSKYYPVDSSMFKGDIYLDPSIKTGQYQLKAYTQWMLNFNPGLIFTKTISVLGEKEAVRLVSNYKHVEDTTSNVRITANKPAYVARDFVILTIDVLDSLDISTGANLSVSVTDIEQAVPIDKEKTILGSYAYDKKLLIDTTYAGKFDIQYGIDFKGNFRSGKKPTQGIITVFQEKPAEQFGIITDSLGRFMKRFWFLDTAKFYINAVTPNKKKGIVLIDTLKRPFAPALAFEPLKLDLYTSDNIRHNFRFEQKAIVLKEATIKSTKIDNEKQRADKIYTGADYSVTGDWIAKNNIMDVTTALARKVPGMSGSIAQGKVNLGVVSSLGGGIDPLVVVDGAPQPATSVDLLNDIPIRSIERIDIIKFGGAASYGSRGANGVIVITTKKNNPDYVPSEDFDKSKLQAVTLTGYSSTADFKSPDYSKKTDNDTFDYRPTIYWNPNVRTDGKSAATVFFYAADVATKYRVVVEGVSQNGQPVRGEKIISIISGK